MEWQERWHYTRSQKEIVKIVEHELDYCDDLIEGLNILHNAYDEVIEIIVWDSESWIAKSDPLIKHKFTRETFRNFFASDQLIKLPRHREVILPWHIETIKIRDFEIIVKMKPLKE